MTKRIFNLLVGFSMIIGLFGVSPTPTVAAVEDPNAKPFPYVMDHLIVKFRPEVKPDSYSLSTHVVSLDNTLAAINTVTLEPMRSLTSTYLLKVGKGTDILSAVEALNQEPAVEYAEPDYLAKFAAAPNDPRYAEQWGLSKIQVEGAWAQTMGSSNIVIAVIDSGIDLTHEDLSPNLWTNPGEIADNGLDDDNNGFVDDTRGWNFVDSSNLVQDYIGHGSLVAGVAAAKSNNGVGIAGVCGNCAIMPVKVSQVSGFANYSDIAAGVVYATQKGARVINISLGGYANSITLKNAINAAVSQNIVVVAGAGNDNKSDQFYPAAYENVIAVAGTDESDQKVDSSNFGDWVDVSAPGQNILSTTLGGYGSDKGTSYAAPFVAGVAGLLLSQHADWTPAMVRGQFAHTSDSIDSLNPGLAGKLGAGRLNAMLAMQPSHPILMYVSYAGNGIPNLRPDFGSAVTLTVSLTNDWADALGVTGTLSTTDSNVTITTPTASFGDILAGETKTNAVAFNFDIAIGAGYSHPMPFTLALSADEGAYTTSLDFTITTRSSEEAFSGTIDADTTWTSDKTYKITGNVGVAPDTVLTIEAGTLVRFAGNFNLNIGGTLIAQGTAEQPIRFEPFTAGGTWGRILFDDSSTDTITDAEGVYQSGNVLQYVDITGAATGIGCMSATPYLDHISTNLGGLSCSLGDTDLWLTNSILVGEVNISGGGSTQEHVSNLAVSGGNVTLAPSAVTGSTLSGTLTIQGDGQVSNSTVAGLTIDGVGDVQQVNSSGSISISSGDVTESSTIGSISIGENSLVSQCELKAGGISAGASSTITRNNIEETIGIGISTTGNSTITYNRIVEAGQGINSSAGIVENNLIANTTGDGLRPGSASVRNNTFIGITGSAVILDEVPAAFMYNNFEFNTGTYDVYVNVLKTTVINLVAQNNWWGTADSDLIKTRTWDYYDDYNIAKLITAPVLTSPSQEAPAYIRSVTMDPPSPVGIQTVNFMVEFSRPMDNNIYPKLTKLSGLEDTWATKTPMPFGNFLTGDLKAAVASNGKIYVLWGFGPQSLMQAYDPQTDIWTTKASVPLSYGGIGMVAASNGKIYAVQGESNYALQVYEYNPQSDVWTTKASGPSGLFSSHMVAASDGKIYVIGGQIYMYEFDPMTDTWLSKSRLPLGNDFQSVAAANNGKIEVFAGDRYLFEFDPQTGSWTTKANRSIWREELGSSTAPNSKIFVIGGRWYDDSVFSLNEEYDPITDIWKTRAPMPTPRSDLALVTASNGKIYTFGGYDGLNKLLTVEEYTPPGWGAVEVTEDPQWLDEFTFNVTFEFTSAVPRGEYSIYIQEALGTDGIKVAPFQSANFLVDYAGEISDTTPPPTPSVYAWGNGSLSQLSAQATANDPESETTGYRYAIGSTPGGTEVVSWTNTSTTEITHTGLLMQPGQSYYVSFQARNIGGLWSPVGVSNPIVNGLPNTSPQKLFLPLIKR